MSTNTECWANFLANEKLEPESMHESDATKLDLLIEKLASKGRPKISMHKFKLESRRLVCETAMEMWFDLPQIMSIRRKPLIGRGLLDAWNKLYVERYGMENGYETMAQKEAARRNKVMEE